MQFTIYFWNNVSVFEALTGYQHNSEVNDDIWTVAKKLSSDGFNIMIINQSTLYVTSHSNFSQY